MLEMYRTTDRRLAPIPVDDIQDGTWIRLVAPTNEEAARVADELGIDFDDLIAATDPEEKARLQAEDGYTLVLVDVPIADVRNDTETYDTIPLGIIISHGCVVTVSAEETSVEARLVDTPVRGLDTHRPVNFLYQVLYRNALAYQRCLTIIDRRRIAFEERIGQPANEDELIGMHELESTLVYFATSLRGNANVVGRIDRSDRFRGYPEDEELLDDVIVEHQQAIEMAQIYREIIDGTRELFSQVMDARLNKVMQRLTSITLILSIPTVIGGLYGMNVDLDYMPLAQAAHGFGLICLITTVICVVLTVFLWKRKML